MALTLLAASAPYFQLALGGYECLVWGLNLQPYTFHPPTMSLAQRGMAIAINGLPHILHGLIQLRSGPRPTDMAVYVGGLSFFTNMQTYFWWLPYFFNIISPLRATQFQQKLEGLAKWLPLRCTSSIVPDVEHTVLFPLSVMTFLATSASFITMPEAKSRHSIFAILASGVLSTLPGFQIMKLPSTNASAEEVVHPMDRKGLGLAVTSSLLWTTCVAFLNLWAKTDSE